MIANEACEFIFVRDETGFTHYLTNDLCFDTRITVFDGFLKKIHNPAVRFIRRVWFSRKVNSFISMPLKRIWKCALRDVHWKHETKYYVIFMGTALRSADYKYLSKLRKNYDIRYILLLLDPWDNDYASRIARYFEQKLRFDYIFSFDPRDAKKYKFFQIDVPYSIVTAEEESVIDYDLYLAANVKTKGGAGRFHEVFACAMDEGVRTHFRLVNVPESEQKYSETIIYNQHIEYPEIVKGVNRSNCILELLPLDQTGETLRYYEAICYNKKLLTNNKNVVSLAFYNPDYIHIFEKPDDIDWKWVKERIPVNYHYDGRFSPTHLIEKIIKIDEERGQKQGVQKEIN